MRGRQSTRAAGDNVVDAELFAMIYEAAAIPELWPQTLDRLASSVDAYGAALVSIDHNSALRFASTETYRPAYTRYHELGGFTIANPRAERAIAGRRFEFLPDIDLCSLEELQHDKLYEIVLRPFGIGWTIGSPVPSPSHDLTYFDLCRLEIDNPFGRREAQLLNQLRPHLARAALLATRLELTKAKATAEALAALGLPAAVVAFNGKVLAANSLLDTLAPRVAVGAFDRLSVMHQPTARLLDRTLRREGSIELPMSIPVPAEEDKPALVLHLLPVERSAHDIFGSANFVLFATPVTEPNAPTADLLSGLFDLSSAEASVARGVANGQSLHEIAQVRGVSLETIRSQLKGALAKTGTRRQVDLVRLLLGATHSLHRNPLAGRD